MGGPQLLERLALSMLSLPKGRSCVSKVLARATTDCDDATFSRLLSVGPPSVPLCMTMLTVVLGSNHPEGVRIEYLRQLLAKDASETGAAMMSPPANSTTNSLYTNGMTVLDLAIQKGFVAGVKCILSHCKPEYLPILVKRENDRSRLTPVALACR